ncbi:MAG: DUF4177 domain-containing protein [Prevotellaceae bacterium]|jgi:hypothetical protein|nr:DUF4177 domain-containing protein [Prevotellaceae bacterium]
MANNNWEYKIVYINATRQNISGLPDDINENFDRWGSEGWELVKVEPKLSCGFLGFGTYTEGYVAFFKKEK